MLTFIRQPSQSSEDILLADSLGFTDVFTSGQLGNHATGGDAGAAAISHEAGLNNSVSINLNPDFHRVPTGSRNPGKPVSTFHFP